MSEQNRTKAEYVKLYAHDHCNDDSETAQTHEIVKEACKELKEDGEENE